MLRCVSPDGSSHRFAGTLPRLIADGEVRQPCDNEVHRHQGPLLTWDYELHLRFAAKALLDVGNGLTYTEAAAPARATAGRGLYGGAEPSGALVAEWIDVFAPLLVGERAERSWPETVVVDSTNFSISNARKGTSKQAFAIVAIYGYPRDSTCGRLDHRIQPVLDAASHSPAGWDGFCVEAQEFPLIARYATRNDAQVRDRVTR